MPDFKLSAELRGHDGDVRAVCFPAPTVVLSTSRDNTVRVWRKTAPKGQFEASITTQGSAYINSLTFLRPTDQYADGLIVSGGKDILIEVKKPTAEPTHNAERLLPGHSENVCALDASPKGTFIVSGSWDGKALVFSTKTWDMTHHLVHDGDLKSVWAVLAYDETTVITGCADGRIRIFKPQANKEGEVEPSRVISTPGVVRALCKLPTGLRGHPSGAEFASAGNDGIIRLWKLNGTEVASLSGHDNFIYSLACLPSGEIVSSGEDRTLRVWRGSQCVQTITHPAISVWTVAVCAETGDIVSGASDNVVRIFTRKEENVADVETLKHFEESVKASAIPQQSLGSTIKKEDQDPKSWLQTHHGTKEGQIKTVREDDGQIGAYQWSNSQGWIHVGIVVESAGSSGRKTTYNGKEYDYVFDVDIEDGKPPLKLPYNLTENPYEAATRFLGDNELPITYLDNVANFIIQNTKGATLGQTDNTPSADPFGTESRYRPDGAPQQPPKPKKLPHIAYLSLPHAKLDAALKKLKELNQKQVEAGSKEITLNPSNISLLESQLATIAKGPGAASSGDEASPATLEATQLILSIISQWPYAARLPALDFLRCLVFQPNVAAQADRHYGNIINIAIRGALETNNPFDGDNKSLAAFIDKKVDEKAVNPNSVMMALRTITNLFSTPQGGKLVASDVSTVLAFLSRVAGTNAGQHPIGPANNNLQIALTSATFNLACLAYRERKKSPPEESVDLGAIAELINIVETTARRQTDGEVLFRCVMTLGMILAAGGDGLALAKSLEAAQWVREAVGKTDDVRVKDVAEECLDYLK